MSCFSGTNIVNDSSLVLALDAANIKSLPYHPSTTDHGISDWYCFATGTATYSCSEPNTAIYQVTDVGIISTVVSSSPNPQRGTITVTAGYRYYGNKPIFLTVEDAQHSIAPISMAEKLFIYAAQRAGSELGTVYFYSPFGPATVTMYSGGVGVNGTATSSITLTKGQSGTFSITTLNWYYFTSTSPVVGTAGQVVSPSWVDKTILSPAKLTAYNRYIGWYATSIGGTPSTVSSYVIADTMYPVVNQTIADGAGGDTAQGLAYEYLCDRYSWGNVLSDYTIVAPYPNTIVTTYYWSGTAWVVWESHSLSGTKFSPEQVQRDGTNGPGVTATIISGGANNMASGATLWKWESNNPIYLCINDSADDELSMLGWMNARNIRTVSDTDTNWYDMSGNLNNGTSNNIRLSSGSLVFSGVLGETVLISSTNISITDYTISFWIKRISGTGIYLYIGQNGASGMYFESYGSLDTTLWFFGANSPQYVSLGNVLSTSSFTNVIVSVNTNTKQVKVYTNGNLITNTTLTNSITAPSSSGSFRIKDINAWSQTWSGEITGLMVYSRILSASEVTQNFNALRGRFGI